MISRWCSGTRCQTRWWAPAGLKFWRTTVSTTHARFSNTHTYKYIIGAVTLGTRETSSPADFKRDVTLCYLKQRTLCLKKRHRCSKLGPITLTQINQFWYFWAEMLLTEYAIKWCNVTPPFLTNVSTMSGKHEPQKLCLFSHAVYRVSKTTLIWLAISSTLTKQF